MPVHPRARHVGHQPGRRAERQFHEPVGDLVGVDRLEPDACRDRDHRQLRHLLRHRQEQVMELGGPQRRPGQAGLATTRSAASLDPK